MTKAKILIIDDEPMIMELLSDFLSKMNYICDTAENLEQGTAKISSGEYAIVVSDLHLPDSSDYNLFTHRKDSNKEFKLVFCTGDTDEKIKNSLLSQGASLVVCKPFSLVAFKKQLDQLLLEAA